MFLRNEDSKVKVYCLLAFDLHRCVTSVPILSCSVLKGEFDLITFCFVLLYFGCEDRSSILLSCDAVWRGWLPTFRRNIITLCRPEDGGDTFHRNGNQLWDHAVSTQRTVVDKFCHACSSVQWGSTTYTSPVLFIQRRSCYRVLSSWKWRR